MKKKADNVRAKSMFPRLFHLASDLNRIKTGVLGKREDRRSWEVVERIVTTVVEAQKCARPNVPFEIAQQLFHQLAEAGPARFTFAVITHPHKPVKVHPMLFCHDLSQESSFDLAHRLWRDFFTKEAYLRLKNCQRCKAWFVDCGRNRRAVFCSADCRDRWWSRAQRSGSAKISSPHKRGQ